MCVGFPDGTNVKNLPANPGDGFDPGSGRSPGGGNSNSLQHSCLENPVDRGAWWHSPGGHRVWRAWVVLLFAHSVVSDSLRPRGLQHLPFSHLQPFPASGSSNESPLRIRWSKCWSFSFSPYSEYPGVIAFLGLTGLILQSKGLSRVFSSTTVQKHQFSFLYGPTLTSIHDYQKNHSFARQSLLAK